MSIIVDNVRAWEADIDRITQVPLAALAEPDDGAAAAVGGGADDDDSDNSEDTIGRRRLAAAVASPYVNRLAEIVASLSSTASSQPVLSTGQIRGLLRQSGLLDVAERIEKKAASRSRGHRSARSISDSIDHLDESGTLPDADEEEPEEEEDAEEGDSSSSRDRDGEGPLPLTPPELAETGGLPNTGDARLLASEIEWLLVSKATVQVYGVLLNTMLEQIMPLHDDIWYWDDILTSNSNLSLYTLQTSPLRFWTWVREVAHVVATSRRRSPLGTLQSGGASLTQQWAQFYAIVRRGVAARSMAAGLGRRLLSPVARCRQHARHSQKRLKQLRQLIASGLGILIDEGLRFDLDDGEVVGSGSSGRGRGVGAGDVTDIKTITADHGRRWKGVVERSVSLMDQVTTDVLAVDHSIADFEDRVFNGVQSDPILTVNGFDAHGVDAYKPARLARRLDRLLAEGIPGLVANLGGEVNTYGRPPWLVRYWLPAGIALLSSSTLLRVVSNRRADLLQWVRDVGVTVRAFWFNWVIAPINKVIGTVRHDANSEIAIMSRESLRSDRDSLERMVVEFARDRPELVLGAATGGNASSSRGPLTDADFAAIRAKVQEGDVTLVLRAYETGLRKPLLGAVRGDLVRSLLIQVQKSKVDLEVAMSGIDALLKSQELVFGFVGLTPGVLVSYSALQYLRGALGGRRGLRRGRHASQCVRLLRNIDRILCDASTDPATLNGILSYKHRGLLVCEVHVLRSLAAGRGGGSGLLPAEVAREFLEDVDEVLNAKTVDGQRLALERVRWAYIRWLR